MGRLANASGEDDRIAARKERAGEVEGEGRVRVEIVPLNQIANRTDEDRLQATPHVGEVKVLVYYDGCCGHKLFTGKYSLRPHRSMKLRDP